MKKIILTSNELQMLRLLAEGVADEQLTKSPEIKKQGVANFKKQLLGKVGVPDAVQAFQVLAKYGFEIKD